MTVYTELLAIADRAFKGKWFKGNDEEIRRCTAILNLQRIVSANPTTQLALTSGVEAAEATSLEAQLNSAITWLRQQTGAPTPESMRPLLAELSNFTFKGFFGNKTLLQLHPEYFTNATVAATTNPQTTFKGSAFAGVRDESFETRMANIARDANQALAHQLVPVSAIATNVEQNPFDNLFDVAPSGTRPQRLAMLGFNTTHPLDACVNLLVNKATSQTPDLGGEGLDSALYQQLLTAIKESINTAFNSHQLVLSAPQDKATSAIALSTATPSSFVLPASFTLENLGKLNKEAAAALLRDTKNFIDEQTRANQKNIPTAKTLLEAMICAGYALAWDTTLRSPTYCSPKDYPRYSMLAALALPSARSDELTTVNAARQLLQSDHTDYEALKQTFEALLVNHNAAVSPHHAITHQAVLLLMSIASGATKNPGEEIKSTSHQCAALRALADLSLACACREFKAGAAQQSPLFETLFAAAKRYRMLFAIHSKLAGQNKSFGTAEAFFTPEIIRAIMQEGDYIPSKPPANFRGTEADADAFVLCTFAHDTLDFAITPEFGNIFWDEGKLTIENVLQIKTFGEYLFAQIKTPEPAEPSPLVAEGFFAAPDDTMFTTKAAITESHTGWLQRIQQIIPTNSLTASTPPLRLT